MAYATNAAMMKRFDHRRIGQLVRDDGTQATAAELGSDSVLSALLTDASAMIDSALLRGGRYTLDDLQNLTGQDAALLQRLVCDLAYGLLVRRRGYTGAELTSLAPDYDQAMKVLEQLANGELVFNVAEVILAGKPRRAVLSYDRALVSSTRRLYGDLTLMPGNPGDPALPTDE